MKYVKIAKAGKNNIILRPELMICLSIARNIASQSLTVAFSPIGEIAFILEKSPFVSTTASCGEVCIVLSSPSIAIGKGCYSLSLSGVGLINSVLIFFLRYFQTVLDKFHLMSASGHLVSLPVFQFSHLNHSMRSMQIRLKPSF